MNKIKGSFYKKYCDAVNNKRPSFYKEKKHLKETYNIDDDIVETVFNNFYNLKDVVSMLEPTDTVPDYNYEKEMLYAFEEFKTELVYDGYLDLSKLITLTHFYLLFQVGYNPCF